MFLWKIPKVLKWFFWRTIITENFVNCKVFENAVEIYEKYLGQESVSLARIAVQFAGTQWFQEI